MAQPNDARATWLTLRGTKALLGRVGVTVTLTLALGCSSEDAAPGNPSTGGMTASTVGGTPAAAGQSSSGGMVGASGSVTVGSAGGGTSNGGAPAGLGGAAAGSAAGGVSSGGVAGTSNAGGSAGAPGKGSPGCGSASPLKSGNFTETIDGTMRKYTVDVPTGYDTNKKYRLIFVWHPLGGSASQVVSGGYNGLKSLSEGSAIFVAAEGLTGGNGEASGPGWWNANNGDMKLLTTMLEKVNANLCVDSARIFSTGFSFGGMMSYTVGYEFDVFRAIAPCSGDLQVIPHVETFTAPLPIMAFHGDKDDFVTTARGRAARDKYLARNKCGTTTMPTSPSPCVEYQGCSAPTFWCEFPGGHSPWSEEPKAIWKFFSQF